MNMFDRFSQTRHALLLGALLLGASLAVQADDIQDANKLFKQGQHAQALEKVNGYLANKPKDAQARFLKGLILTEQGNTNDAIKVFSALTEDYPELPEPYNNLAVLYASKGQYDKAKMALEMAIRTHPSYATAHENLGDIYAKMASQAYDRALQLDRGNTATQTKLSMIQDLFAGGNARGKRTAPAIASSAAAAAPAPAAAPAAPAPAPASAPASKPEPTAPVVVAAAPTKPVPVEKPVPAEKKEPAPTASTSKDVLKAVDTWAAAWSSKDVKKYLSFYASDFKTPNGESRSDWEATRAERIKKPKSIQVVVHNPKVSFSDGRHAVVEFRQSYRASHMKTASGKTLVMVKTGGKWLIQEERTN